jgi:hypothetical protein
MRQEEIDIIKGRREDPSNKKHQTEIFEYIRRRKGGKTHKVGVVFAVKVEDAVKIGWSKCNERAGDKFDGLLGLQYAMNRAMKPDNTPTPNCIRKQLRCFGARAVRYFKNVRRIELPA